MDTVPKLGDLIEGEAHRDAIHIAIAPVIAAVAFAPGALVSLTRDGLATFGYEEPVGIVDPFLREPVKRGEKFYLFLKPGSITSLRHNWTHPAFSAIAPAAVPASSEAWMRAWAKEHMSEDYYGDGDGPVDEGYAYASAIRAGHEHFIGPYEDARDHIDNEWWSHWEAITGEQGDREAYFSCSC